MIERLRQWVRRLFTKPSVEPQCDHIREYHLMEKPDGPGLCEDYSRPPYPCEICQRKKTGLCPCHGLTPAECYQGYLNGPGA